MSDFLKGIGAVTLMLSTVAVVLLTFCWLIDGILHGYFQFSQSNLI